MPFDGNTVPLGEAGTGAAYILPQSQAINQISDYLDKRAKDQQDSQVAAAKQAASLAKSWQQNRINIKAGTLWQPEINAKVNDVMQKGMALRKAGIDPSQYYNDPNIQKSVEDYNNDRMAAMNMGEARDAFAKQAEPIDKQISEDDGSLNPDSIKAHHDFFNIPLSKIMANGYQMPGVSKSFNEQKAIDLLPTSKIDTTTLPDANGVEQQLILPNKDAHLRTAANYVNNTPQVRSLISKQTGIPFDQIGNETDPSVIKQQLDAQYRSLPNIPSLAAQGVKTFGGLAGSNTNSNGVPDANGVIPPKAVGSVPGTPYDDLLNKQATKLAAAAKLKQAKIQDAYQQLNDKVGETNKQTLNFKYQEEQDRRERMRMDRERFNDWAEKQQNEKGSFTLGNQNSYVPVIKQNQEDGKKGQPFAEPEKGASLYGVNLPSVETVVRPSVVTNTATGKTSKNTDPMNVKVSQLQMVPVYKGLTGDMNGAEISARQLKEIMAGTNKSGLTTKNISFQPYVYGLQTQRITDPATKAAHLQDVPVKFSYDALKGSNVKKINTTPFDNEGQKIEALKQKMTARGMSPNDQVQFLLKYYGTNLDN